MCEPTFTPAVFDIPALTPTPEELAPQTPRDEPTLAPAPPATPATPTPEDLASQDPRDEPTLAPAEPDPPEDPEKDEDPDDDEEYDDNEDDPYPSKRIYLVISGGPNSKFSFARPDDDDDDDDETTKKKKKKRISPTPPIQSRPHPQPATNRLPAADPHPKHRGPQPARPAPPHRSRPPHPSWPPPNTLSPSRHPIPSRNLSHPPPQPALAELYDYPILQPETNQVFLAVDECNKGLAKAAVRITNLGQGKLTYSVPNTGAALVSQVTSGVAPATINFIMEPGRAGVVRQPGTNLSTGQATMTGVAINVNLASVEAINIPNTIRVYMNYRQSDMRGVIYPLPTGLTTAEGLQDLVLDEARGRLYITNSGFNRVEVFDTKKLRFLDPIKVGQLPHQMALGTDGTTLYVANTGGESISIVDLDLVRETGQVEFPPIPRAGNAATRFVRTMAMGLRGLQFIMDNGSQWKLVGNLATVRPLNDGVTPNNFSGYTTMLATPGYDDIITLDGNGTAYLYDGLLDAYTRAAKLFNNPIQSYYGILTAAPNGAFYLANGLILNSSLTAIGGAERPGIVQTGPPAGQGQPPSQTVVSAGQRNVAAQAPVSERMFVRITTPVRQNVNAVTRDDVRTTIESVDICHRLGVAGRRGAGKPQLQRLRHFADQRPAAPDGGRLGRHRLCHHHFRPERGSAFGRPAWPARSFPTAPAPSSTPPTARPTSSPAPSSPSTAATWPRPPWPIRSRCPRCWAAPASSSTTSRSRSCRRRPRRFRRNCPPRSAPASAWSRSKASPPPKPATPSSSRSRNRKRGDRHDVPGERGACPHVPPAAIHP